MIRISKAHAAITTLTLLFTATSFATTSIETENSDSISATAYIVGGDDVAQDYPWMAALYNGADDVYGFTCGAVLISSNWVATAAHCVYEDDDESGVATAYDASDYKLVIGQSTHYSTTQDAEVASVDVYNISNIIIHPSYVAADEDEDTIDYDYDIALLELETPYYQPGPAIATSARFDSIEEGDLLTNLGYGYTSGDATHFDIPTTLQEVDLPFVPTNECSWNDDGDISDNMLCAGYEDTTASSCTGDSGGPVFATIDGELTLVGLVSWGSTTCSGAEGVYTNVSNLRSWILSSIDGYQVVESGTAFYNSNYDTFSSGLISVYHYGDESDASLEIGTLTFNDEITESLLVSDSCSDTTLYASSGDCAINFELLNETTADSVYEATLQVKESDNETTQSYALNFITEVDDSVEDTEDTDSSSGGSTGIIAVLCLALLSLWRIRSPLYFSNKRNLSQK